MRAKPGGPLPRLLLLALVAVSTSGCYLGHVVSGQLRILRARQPIEALLADPATPPELRERLKLVRATRRFAAELGLTVGDHYTSYAPWPGTRIVTIVVATRPGEVEPAGFWFPIVGRMPYKGFFDPLRAEAEAERLRADGLDVCQSPVRAYSLLGWIADPVTGPMLGVRDGPLVEMLLHELVHASAFAPGQARFNEGVATFIGGEGSIRFFQAAGLPAAAQRRRLEVEDARRLGAELERLRSEVEAIYATGAPASQMAIARVEGVAVARARIADLPLRTRDPAALAASLALNDGCLALAGTYGADLPRYDARLAALGGDLPRFLAAVREAAGAEDARRALLGEAAAD